MSIERDPDAIVDAWLEEGPTWLPDPTRRAIAVSIRTTHRTRRPDRVTRRFSTMNGLSRYALAAAAVVAVAVGGTLLFDVGPPAGVGGPTASSIPTPIPTPTEIPMSFDDHPGGRLVAGGYAIDALAPLRITFVVPDGWVKNAVPTAIWTPDSEARLGFFTVDNVAVDACEARPRMHAPPVGPSVDDLVTALMAVPGIDATASDVALAGFTGKQVQVTTRLSCAEAESSLFRVNGNTLNKPAPGPGADTRYWILDVDGQRVLIAQVVRPGAVASGRDALVDIVGSIRIERLESAP